MKHAAVLLFSLLLAPIAVGQPIEDIDPDAAPVADEQLTVQQMLDRAHALVDDPSRPYTERWLEALNLVIQALAWDPNHPQIYIELARITTRLGSYSPSSMNAAEAHLKRALELDPGNSFAYVLLGWLGIHRQDYAAAEEHLNTAEAMGSDDPWLDYNWAVLLGRTNRMDQALDHYWALVDPPHANRLAVEKSLSNLLSYYMDIKDWETAEPLIERWGQYEASQDDVNTVRAEFLWKAKRDLEGALHYAELAYRGGFGKSDQWFSSFLSGLLALSATKHFEAGDTEAAWQQFAQAERLANLGDLMVAAAANSVTYTGLRAAPGSPEDEISIVYAMVEYGIPVNARSDGYGSYALHLRVAMNDKVNVDKLLSLGADPNLLDSAGMNALHMAVVSRAEDVVNSLLNAGADPQASIVVAPGAQLPEHLRGEKTPLSIAERQGDPASMRIGHMVADYMGVRFPSWATRNLALMDWEELKPLLFIGMGMPDGTAKTQPQKSTILEDAPGELLILQAPLTESGKPRAAVYLHGRQAPSTEELQMVADMLRDRGVALVSFMTFADIPDVGRLNVKLGDYRAGFNVAVYAGQNALDSFNGRTTSRTGKGDYYLDWGETRADERRRQIEATQVDTENLVGLSWNEFRVVVIRAINAGNAEIVEEQPNDFMRLRSSWTTPKGKNVREYLVLRRPDSLDYDELDAIVNDTRSRNVHELEVIVTAEITQAARNIVFDQMKRLPLVSLIDKASLERSLSRRRDKIYVIDWAAPVAERKGHNLAEVDWATISRLVLERGVQQQDWAAAPSQIEKITDRPYDLVAWDISNETWFPPMPRRVVFLWRREPLSPEEFLAVIDEFEADTRLMIVPMSGLSPEIEHARETMELIRFAGFNVLQVLNAAAEAGSDYYVDWDTPLAKLDPASR